MWHIEGHDCFFSSCVSVMGFSCTCPGMECIYPRACSQNTPPGTPDYWQVKLCYLPWLSQSALRKGKAQAELQLGGRFTQEAETQCALNPSAFVCAMPCFRRRSHMCSQKSPAKFCLLVTRIFNVVNARDCSDC